jgi:antitoxin component YwqK of YwqJK toxin-antitoxin module
MTQLFILIRSEMTKIFLFGITCTVLLASCSNEKNTRNAVISYNQEYWDIYYNPESVDIKSDNRVDYYWFESGKIHVNQGGYSDYLLVSECKVYSENNKMIEKGQFKNGMKTGLWQKWDEDGTLIESTHYNNGHKHGEALNFFEDGKLKLKRHYKKGQLDGKTEAYYNSLSLKETRNYKRNVLCGKRTYYDKNQNIIKTEEYKNGELNGKQIIYTQDTTVTHRYKNGVLIKPEPKKNIDNTLESDTTNNNGIFKKLFSKKKKPTQNKD